uniref:Piwi domain-containing protein n=1 Tax=Ditylenchus dipsaci TaxID=166011 RepID=A0A915DWN8_9BILA
MTDLPGSSRGGRAEATGSYKRQSSAERQAEREAELRQVQSIKLHDKIHNQHLFRNVEFDRGATRILLNGYRVELGKAVDVIHKFELKFWGTFEFRKKGVVEEEVKELSRGPRNDVATNNKRRLLWELYQLLILSNTHLFGEDPNRGHNIYDCGINFYSTNQIFAHLLTKEEFSIDQTQLPAEVQPYLGPRVKAIMASLNYVEQIDLRSNDGNFDSRDRSVAQFLDILTTQQILKDDRYFMFASKMFEKASNIGLGDDPRILKEGMQKNVRFIGDSPKMLFLCYRLMVAKKSAFFPAVPLVDFLQQYLNPTVPLEQALSQDRYLRKGANMIKAHPQLDIKSQMCNQLRYQCVTTHLPNQKMFIVYDLAAGSASRQRFEKDGQSTTVEAYFSQVYAINLRRPNLPCVIERRGTTTINYYPLEVLNIIAGQRVPRQKQNDITDKIISACLARPFEFRSNIERQKGKALLDENNNNFLREHKVRINREIETTDAERLFAPAIFYSANDVTQPGSDGSLDNWMMVGKMAQRDRHYVAPAQFPKVWATVVFQREVSEEDKRQFLQSLSRTAVTRGVQMRQPMNEAFDLKDIEYIKSRFNTFRQNHVEYVMYFTKNKTDYVHNIMKLMEIDYKIVTQNVTVPTLNKAIGKGARQSPLVIENILLKLNLKLGGINHSLATSQEFLQRNADKGILDNFLNLRWMNDCYMFLGLDLSHAAPQSFMQRQANQQTFEPTIVGVAYTLGHPVKMRGTYLLQESRVTYIQTLKDTIKMALYNFADERERFPTHMFVYRGGVSEGEYRIIVHREKSAFDAALDEIQEEVESGGNTFHRPNLTIIVVQRASNYRIVPFNVNRNAPAHAQNVPCGTVVDKQIMHPTLTEFLLVGHKTIQGTAHPARCTVVWNECQETPDNRVPLQDLEYITYSLCFTHGVVTSPVSVPAVLYSASDLAKRGRNNWKASNYDGDEYGSGRGKHFFDGPEDMLGHYYVDLTEQLKPKIVDKKFWA